MHPFVCANDGVRRAGRQAARATDAGGFVYHRIGRVPVVGDAVVIEPFLITVIKVSGRRVGKVRVRWTPVNAAASSGDEGK